MVKNVKEAIKEFRRRAVLKNGDEINLIILYGSVVKGKYNPKESDIDIIVIAKKKDIDEDILEIETKISLKYGVVMAALLITEKEFKKGKNSGYSFFNELLKGKVIYERHNNARNEISL